MTLTTTNMGLLQAQGTDNARDYLKTFLAASLASIDAHDHSSTKGVPVKRLANGTFASRPAAGNAGHVYLSTDSNRVTWDNGSSWIEAVINATSQAVSLGGGLTVTAGGLAVSAGNVGIGGAAVTNQGLAVLGSILSGSISQQGINSNTTYSSSATSTADGVASAVTTATAIFNVTTAADFHAYGFAKGTGSTITSAYGLLVEAVNAGGTNNLGVSIVQPSGGSGSNVALQVGGVLAGAITAGAVINGNGALLGGSPTTGVSGMVGLTGVTTNTGGGAGAGLGTIGGSGPTSASQAGWWKITDQAGIVSFVPFWH